MTGARKNQPTQDEIKKEMGESGVKEMGESGVKERRSRWVGRRRFIRPK